jgi:hypothetical protein
VEESRVKRSDLYRYQAEKVIPAMVERDHLAVFLNMGMGKTVCSETALLDRGMPRTVLFAPARVVELDVWGRETQDWDHLKGLRVNPIVGSAAQRKKLLAQPADIDVVSYHNLHWLVDQVDCPEKRWGAVGFDELTNMKHPGARWFRYMRNRMMDIPIRFGLTGIPRENHLRDLWGQMYAVAGDAPLGGSKVGYDMTYFTAYPISEHVKGWSVNHGSEELIFNRIKPWCYHIDPADAPRWEVRPNRIEVQLPNDIRRMTDELANELETHLQSGTELIALSAGSRMMKIRQLVGGAVYTDPSATAWEEVGTHKLDALEEALDSLQGEPALIVYWYRHEAERIKARFPGIASITDPGAIDLWNARKLDGMLLHPASAGYGLNLQKGGHNLIWYTIPFSYGMWSQTNARLARPGQLSPFVMAHVLEAGSVDAAVFAQLVGKQSGHYRMMDSIRSE